MISFYCYLLCGHGGTADALASGASGGNPVEVQILLTAPFLFVDKLTL